MLHVASIALPGTNMFAPQNGFPFAMNGFLAGAMLVSGRVYDGIRLLKRMSWKTMSGDIEQIVG